VESSCPSNITVKSVSDGNVTLFIVPGETKTQVKLRISACNNSDSACETTETRIEKKKFLIKPDNHTFDGLESSTRYKAQFVIELGMDGSVECNESIYFTTEGGMYKYL
jgi:hypothetical protein